MSMRLGMEADRVRDRVEHGDPYWPAQLAVGLAIVLNLSLASQITIGPRWLLPGVEGILLVALVVIAPARATVHRVGERRFALSVIGLVSLVNIVLLARLVDHLINGSSVGGRSLILSGAVLWVTNVLLFAVWYWEMDRGGPVARYENASALVDFQFPQMDDPKLAPEGWRPGFLDYLYVSLTNSTAFSPTDTMPLTQRAKVIMGFQSVIALLTIGIVVARAVNALR
jgi:uncharacterized membrane protein